MLENAPITTWYSTRKKIGNPCLVSGHTAEAPKEAATEIEGIVGVRGEILIGATVAIGHIAEVPLGETLAVTGTGASTTKMIDVATVTVIVIETADVGRRASRLRYGAASMYRNHSRRDVTRTSLVKYRNIPSYD
ncbi:hypothetical protein GCM10020218_079910 [Dactylosporangium vinaceum]